MSKRFFFIIAALVFFSSSAWAQLSTTSPWPKKHNNLKNTGFTNLNSGTTTGKEKWAFEAPGRFVSSPVLDNNGKVYIGSTEGTFYAINRIDGSLAWKYTTTGAIEHSSPAIDVNGVIYVGNMADPGRVYAFNTNTINPDIPSTWVPLWTYDTGGGIQGSITIDTDGSIIVPSNDGFVHALNPNGTLKWRSARNYGSIFTTPAIDTATSRVLFGSQEPQDRFYTYYDGENVPASVTCDVIPVFNFYKAPTFFTVNKDTGIELTNFPSFCPPGGMTAAPVVYSNGDYLVPFLKQTYGSFCTDNLLQPKDAQTWAVSDMLVPYNAALNYPVDNTTCTDILVSDTGSSFGKAYTGEIWSTPAVFTDNSYVIGEGTQFARYYPSGNLYNGLLIDVGARIESSPAIDKKLDVYFGTNGGQFLCFCASCSEGDTLIKWQFPSDGSQLTDQFGDIVEIKSSPAIDNDAKHSIYVGANNGTLYAFFDGPSIYGTITLNNGDPLNGVKVTVTNTQTGIITTVYTDATGYYVTPGLDSGQYQVIPQLNNYVFNPSDAPVTLKTIDQNLDFKASLSFTLQGKVASVVDNTGLPQVAIKLVTKNALGDVIYSDNSTQTDADGNYTFTGIGYGTTTLTPSRPGWGFDPPSIDQVITSADPEGTVFPLATFAGTLGYQVSGKVIDATKPLDDPDNGIADVTVTITSGTSFTDTRTTNPQGQYSFTGLANGTYIVKPTRVLYKFSPTNRTVPIDSASALDQNFYGATGSTISGTLKLSGDDTSFEGFTVNLYVDDETFFSRIFNRNKPRTLVSTVTVGTDGFFIFMGVAAGKYIVEPAKDGYGFDPASEKVTVTGLNDVGSLVFTAVGGFTISGRMHSILGLPQAGIGVTLINNLTGQTYAAISGLDGSYTFTGLESGLYTVAPDFSDFYTASPASKNVTIALDSIRRVNFLVISFCSTTYITLPFWGSTDANVYVLGTNFGPPPSDDESAVAITLYDGTTTSKPAGVYFGSNDPNTWVPATVTSWTPVLITAQVPLLDLRILRVWVVRPGLSTCINNSPLNIFINSRGLF